MLFLECSPAELATLVRLIRKVITIICIAVPIALILFGTIDMAKAVMAQKDDEVKKAQEMLIKRFIYAVIVFFVPFLVGFIMKAVADVTNNDDARAWSECWDGSGATRR